NLIIHPSFSYNYLLFYVYDFSITISSCIQGNYPPCSHHSHSSISSKVDRDERKYARDEITIQFPPSFPECQKHRVDGRQVQSYTCHFTLSPEYKQRGYFNRKYCECQFRSCRSYVERYYNDLAYDLFPRYCARPHCKSD